KPRRGRPLIEVSANPTRQMPAAQPALPTPPPPTRMASRPVPKPGPISKAPRPEHDEIFAEMANGLPLIVWVHDETGRQVMVNDTFCEYFGVTHEELHGGRWQLPMHPDDARAYLDELEACLREQRPF